MLGKAVSYSAAMISGCLRAVVKFLQRYQTQQIQIKFALFSVGYQILFKRYIKIKFKE